MKTRYTVAMAVVVGFALGAVSIHSLHAQAKPPVFVIAEIDVSNPDGYAKEYAPKAQALIKKMGGKLLAVSTNVVAFEGAPAKRIAIQQWESMEKVKAWQSSAELKDNRKIGNKYAKFRVLALEGVTLDVAAGELVCLEPATGKQVWTTDRVTDLKGGASIHLTPHGDSMFLYTDRGELTRARLTPQGYEPIGRAAVRSHASFAAASL